MLADLAFYLNSNSGYRVSVGVSEIIEIWFATSSISEPADAIVTCTMTGNVAVTIAGGNRTLVGTMRDRASDLGENIIITLDNH